MRESLSASLDRAESRRRLCSQLLRLLETSQFETAKSLLAPAQAADIADVIESLPSHLQVVAFRLLSKNEAIQVYEHLELPWQEALLKDFKHSDVLEIFDQISPDERARLFEELPAKVTRQLFQRLSPEERQVTSLLLGYPPETAGRIMTPEYISLREDLNVQQALERIR
ncbi:MAG: magnesium transporter MgtE N-terminal domain-containing protein, partial [Cyanobacteriota bacterium]